MAPRDDQLAVLRRLKSEGRISEAEYDRLAGDASPRAETSEPNPERGTRADDHRRRTDARGLEPEPDARDLAADDEAERDDEFSLVPPFPPRIRADMNLNVIGVILLAGLALIVLASLNMVPWWVSFPAILVLTTLVFDGWRAVTVAGSLVVAAFLIIDLAASAGEDPAPEAIVAVTSAPQDPYPPVPGSLGIYMEQLPGLWNEVSGPPRITKGLTRHNEIGEYDSFIYRFGEWGRVAGAYDPVNDAIYALLVTGQFSGNGTAQLYLHLCHLVAAYSPECIQSYQEVGLGELTLTEYQDQAREAEWVVGDSTWRLEISGNVVTIRVYGPDAA